MVKVPKPPQRTPITSPNTDTNTGSTNENATPEQEEREYEQGEAGINKDEMGIVKRLITAFKDTVDTSNRTITELIERTSQKEEKETTFLRTPLRAKSDEILDLATKEGAKFYERANKSLYDNGPKFDVEPTQFWTFIDLLNTRVRDLGMLEVDANLYMDMDSDAYGETEYINPIIRHGRYTHDDMMRFEATFVNSFTRKSQNSKVLYDLLMNSLSTTGLKRIYGWKAQYHINGQEAGG